MIRRSSYVAVLLLTVLGACSAAPTTASTYDQRQEGGVNVNVDLENFLVLVARPSSSSSSSGLDFLGSLASLNAMAGLASRAAASTKESEAAKEQRDAEAQYAQQQRQQHQQQQQQPEVVAQAAQGQQEAKEPEKVVLVVQEAEKAGKSLEDIVRTLRNLKSKQPVKEEGRGAAGKYKFVDAVEEPQNLKLVGDGLENCGPGRSRDRLGICEGDAVSPE